MTLCEQLFLTGVGKGIPIQIPDFNKMSPNPKVKNLQSQSQSQKFPNLIPIPKFWRIDLDYNPKDLRLELKSNRIGIPLPTPGSE